MKRLLFLFTLALSVTALATENRKVYEVRYTEDIPDSVAGWSLTGLLKDRSEARFVPYNQADAENLILDATADRGAELDEGVAARRTAFRAAYNDEGISIYIDAEEPLINQIREAAIDRHSPIRQREAFEVFFAPGLHKVPYYQLFIRPIEGTTQYYDWGSPHRHYRSLKEYAGVDARIVKEGYGILIRIPWEAIYEYLPKEDTHWRFGIVRWMPFGKAGGVSWGGKVHETGRFGLLHLRKPTPQQLEKIEARMARYAWYRFQSLANRATTFWSDEKVGDPAFYNEKLKPLIDEYTALGASLGEPENWNAASLAKIAPVRENWLEFDYLVSELRSDYLMDKRVQ